MGFHGSMAKKLDTHPEVSIYIYMWYILFEYLVSISVPGNHASAKAGLLQHPTKLTTHSSLNSQL